MAPWFILVARPLKRARARGNPRSGETARIRIQTEGEPRGGFESAFFCSSVACFFTSLACAHSPIAFRGLLLTSRRTEFNNIFRLLCCSTDGFLVATPSPSPQPALVANPWAIRAMQPSL